MEQFEFVLPLNRSELKSASGRDQYVVEDEFTTREITLKIKDIKAHVERNGSDYILKRPSFDVFYSALCEFENLSETVKCDIWELALKSVKKLEKNLVTVLEDDHLDLRNRKKYLNILKMTIYIFTELMDCFECEVMKPSVVATKAKGKKKAQKKSYDSMDWDHQKENGIHVLQQFFQLNIKKLWDPPIIEESFINLITSACFKVLENPASLRIKSLKDSIIDLLALSLETSRNSLGLSLKLIQMIQNHDHLVTALVDAVECFVLKHNARNIVNVIIREIGLMEGSDVGQDSSAIKSVSLFLAELAERIPDIVLQSITHLITFLDNDAYTMRICTLTIMGEIISKNLNKEGMDEKSKKLRDQFMDELELHLHDVNAFVRSKVLQVWQKLLAEGVIPLCRQQTLLQLISDRLLDKSSLVRKNAMFFITEFLKHNRLVAMLSLEEVQDRLAAEQNKLEDMMPKDSPIPLNLFDSESEWKEMEKDIQKALKKFEPLEEDDDEVEDSEDEEDINSEFDEIRRFLENEDFDRAFHGLFRLKKSHKDHSFFIANSEDPLEGASFNQNDQNLDILKRIFTKRYKKDSLQDDLMTQPAAIMLNEEAISNEGPVVNEISKQQILVKWLEDCVLFSQQICIILPRIVDLLSSKTQTDILEAINFFVTAQELGVKGAVYGVKKFLPLIRSKESTLKDAVVTAFKRLYLNPIPKGDRSKWEEIVFGLSLFLQVLTLGELQALEELIGQWMVNKEIHKNVLNIMWQKFLKQTTDDDKESHLSLLLLGMAASTEPDVIKANLEHLIEIGLGERAERDFLFGKDVCAVLMKLSRSDKIKVESKTPAFRYPKDHKMFQRISEILLSGLKNKDKYWSPFCQIAIKFFYKSAENPDDLCVKLIVDMLLVIDSESEKGDNNDAYLMSRLITTLGEVAINHLVYLDFYIFNELKRRSYLKDQKKESKEQQKRRSAFVTMSQNNKDTSAMDLELGLIGAEVDDTEADFIAKVCEDELLREDGLLGKFLPMVTSVCSDPAKYHDVNLRTASSLTLGKLMLISPTVCEKHLPLLVTILEKSIEPEIRANVIILLRDLSLRFPNLLDPWTTHLYGRLKDNDVEVRKNTLAVLKDLILNDLVKVKSHMSDIALCLVDDDQYITDSTNEFFNELSKRGNALYNVLPDIISHLSDPDVGTNEGNFKLILKTLLGLIEKDKQLEQLIEKLCLRFNSTRVDRQDRDLAFCLSLLNFNERSLRKLQDNIACFAEKLRDVDIYDNFLSILNASKKIVTQKTGSTVLVDELSALFEQLHLKGLDGNARRLLAEKQQQKKGKAPKTPRKKRNVNVSSGSSEEDFTETNRKKQSCVKQKKTPGIPPPREPSKRKKALEKIIFSDSDDD